MACKHHHQQGRRRRVLLAAASFLAVQLLWTLPQQLVMAAEEGGRIPLKEPVDQMVIEAQKTKEAAALESEAGRIKRGEAVSPSSREVPTSVLVGIAIMLALALAAVLSASSYLTPDFGLNIPMTTNGDVTLEEVPEMIVDGIAGAKRLTSGIVDGTYYISSQPHPYPEEKAYLLGLSPKERQREKEHLLEEIKTLLGEEPMTEEPTTRWIEPKLRSGATVDTMLHVFKLQPKKKADEETPGIGDIESALMNRAGGGKRR